MKSTRVSFCAALLSAALLFPACGLRAQQYGPINPTPTPAPPPPQVLLSSKPWKFVGDSWFVVRIFSYDGTFKTLGDASAHGTWAVTGAVITIAFADGHKDLLPLPLNPLGSDGIGRDGRHFTAIMSTASGIGAAASGYVSPLETSKGKPARSGLDSLGPATANPAQQQQNAAATAMLISAPWKVIGISWYRIRTFTANGLFTTENTPSEHGTWSIANNKISLSFVDGHIDTLLLPLDPKGTDGTDDKGTPSYAIQQNTSAPAPSSSGPAPAPASAGPTPFGSRQPGQ